MRQQVGEPFALGAILVAVALVIYVVVGRCHHDIVVFDGVELLPIRAILYLLLNHSLLLHHALLFPLRHLVTHINF